MLLIDEAEKTEDGRAIGKYTVRGDEFFLQGHFPGNPVVPGVILCEIMAQTCCVLFSGETFQENYRILIQKIREVNEHIPPLINAYMNLSPSMRVFDTVSNPDFGGVEETGILVTVPDIYPEKKERYMRWEGWRRNLRARREAFRIALIDHRDRIKKRRKQRQAAK